MTTPTEQPGATTETTADIVKLRAKVLELEEMAQAKREGLRKIQEEKESTAKKEKEKERLRSAFADGKKLAEWMIKREPYRNNIDIPGCYTMFGSPSETIHTDLYRYIEEHIQRYIDSLRGAFRKLQDQFEGREKLIYDPRREKKLVSYPRDYSKDRVYPASSTIINGCCGGVNEHCVNCRAGNDEEVPLCAEELEVLHGKQEQEFDVLKKEFEPGVTALHAHMEGFITTVLLSNPIYADNLFRAVKVAMVAGVGTLHEFGGREMVFEYLQTTVIGQVEAKLTTSESLDEAGIAEIEKILKAVQEAVGQQIVHK